MEYLANYGLFLAQTVTIVAAIAVILVLIIGLKQKNNSQKGEIQVIDLSEKYEDTERMMQTVIMNAAEQKLWEKNQKKIEKEKRKQEKLEAKQAKKNDKNNNAAGSQPLKSDTAPLSEQNINEVTTAPVNDTNSAEALVNTSASDQDKSRVFVIDFDGSMSANEVGALREEITAILTIATPDDKVVVRLTSPGGVVHGYGLAASQLSRIKNANIPLIAVVDKVAASGGYMMACVADKIIAAPFAIIGSIGVVAQVPNFHRLLKKNEIDVELHTAGAFKRTLTLFGENTDEGREKFKQELNETHELFKEFVSSKRPSLDIESVATGEHWYGSVALNKGLVDEVSTSDDYLQSLYKAHKVLNIKYVVKKSMTERVTKSASQSLIQSVMSIWQNNQRPQV